MKFKYYHFMQSWNISLIILSGYLHYKLIFIPSASYLGENPHFIQDKKIPDVTVSGKYEDSDCIGREWDLKCKDCADWDSSVQLKDLLLWQNCSLVAHLFSVFQALH